MPVIPPSSGSFFHGRGTRMASDYPMCSGKAGQIYKGAAKPPKISKYPMKSAPAKSMKQTMKTNRGKKNG